MKIRVMGTREECEQAQRFYEHLSESDNVLHSSVSGLYPNRGSKKQYRVYIEIVCKTEKIDIYNEAFMIMSGYADEPNTEDETLFPACLDDVQRC